jgi:carboxymethylenebutenolidase
MKIRPTFVSMAFACALAVPAAWSEAAAAASDTLRVRLGTADAGTDAYVALPSGTGAAPAVVIFHEWWGLNGQIREIAQRIASQGYVAIVPDLYHGKVASDPEGAHVLVRGLDAKRAMQEAGMAIAWLRAQPRTAKSRIGCIGFCMGGSLSLGFALENRDIAAAVMFYGPPETDPAKLANLRVPLQGHFGATDDGIPGESVKAFESALAKAGKKTEIYVYAGAGHAFMHEGRPSYRPDAARQAWARTLGFLQKYLKG